MDRLWIGLIAGCVLGGIAGVLVRDLATPPPGPVGSPPAPAAAVHSGVGQAMRAAPFGAASASGAENAPAGTATAPLRPATGGRTDTPTAVPVSPGFEHVLGHAAAGDDDWNPIAKLHDRVSAETRDDSWAGPTEEDIKTYLAGYLDQHGLDRSAIGLLTVQCGSTLCEVQAQGQADGSPRDWQVALFELLQGPLGEDFRKNDLHTAVFGLPNDQSGYVSFLSRKIHP